MDIGCGDDCKDTAAIAGAGEVDQGNLPGTGDLAKGPLSVAGSAWPE